MGEHIDEGADDGVGYRQTDRILKCGGCGDVYFARGSWCSEDDHHYQDDYGEYQTESGEVWRYWPAMPTRVAPSWLSIVGNQDDGFVLDRLFDEAYGALNAGYRVLSVIGLRTIFDRASEILEVDPAIRFEEKLAALAAGGSLNAEDHEALGVLVEAGNAAAHRGWSPDDRELELLFDIAERFLHKAFIKDARLARLKESIPAKPARKKS